MSQTTPLKNQKGFTIVEIIVVVVIIFIVGFSIVVTQSANRAKRAFENNYRKVEGLFQEVRGLSISGQAFPDIGDKLLIPNGYIVNITQEEVVASNTFIKQAYAANGIIKSTRFTVYADLWGSEQLDDLDSLDIEVKSIVVPLLFNYELYNPVGDTIIADDPTTLNMFYQKGEQSVAGEGNEKVTVVLNLYTLEQEEIEHEYHLLFYYSSNFPEGHKEPIDLEPSGQEPPPPEPPPFIPPDCGNGILDKGEECDDANNVDGDGCSASCTEEYQEGCGNGFVDRNEECDDGNTRDFDGCSSQCLEEICGNRRVDPGEECDNGVNNSDTYPDACRTNCLYAYCGDGVLDYRETCDDSNSADGDGCSSTCVNEMCGDGKIDSGEECDDGPANSDTQTDACRTNCTNPVCGDTIVDSNEECDDGNQIDTDSCRNNCTLPFCGDNVIDANEECDDGNQIDTDSCRNNCTLPFCGDGVIDTVNGENCDDGGHNSDTQPDACRRNCVTPWCGDGVRDPEHGESCDLGEEWNSNTIPNTCRTNCVTPWCGDGVWDEEYREQCDFKDPKTGEGCTERCTRIF